MTALEDRTALQGMEERLFKLVSKNATPAQWSEWLRPPLEHAVAHGDYHLVLSLLKAGANGGAGWKGGCDGRTLLDAAAESGNSKVVSALLEAGSLDDVNAASGSDRMPVLHRVIAGGHATVARVLMLAGADVSLLDFRNRSALHYAVQGGHSVLAGDVVIAGADVNAKDRDGETPLHLASAAGDHDSVCTLLRRGGRVGVVDSEGRCPLHAAVRGGHIEVAEALLKAGADPSACYGKNLKSSPLQLACSSSRSSRDAVMTRTLLEYGADVGRCDGLGFTALHWAAYRGEPCVIDTLVEGGADTEARSSQVWHAGHQHPHVGLTPLHIASFFRRGHTSRMAALLRKGADIDARDGEGQTPLHITTAAAAAAKNGSATAGVDFLLRGAADETITDNYGRTPEDLVFQSTDADLTGRLRRLLANAKTDRVWRRRGMLVLCRAYSERALRGDKRVLVGKCFSQGKWVGSGPFAGWGRGGKGCDALGWVVSRLEIEEVFRTIVAFL
ncbi:unnamed protein product [Pylaiella littoralis]